MIIVGFACASSKIALTAAASACTMRGIAFGCCLLMMSHAFPADMGELRPKTWYHTMSQRDDFVYDAAQAAAIEELDALWSELVVFKSKRNHFLGRSLLSPDVPQGMYIWGGVGRGKTFLMDAFYACVPYRRKRRVHFHHFMAEVHHEMQHLSQEKDPLLALAKQIAHATRLLCLDELHVDNIADAMILGRLIAALFEQGVVLMTTSNYPPDGLYPNGLQRQHFLPTIDLLNRELTVLNVDNGNDYRLRGGLHAPLFMVPDDAASAQRMDALFAELTHDAPTTVGTVLDRAIPVIKQTEQVVWFDFQELCGRAHGQNDYLAIAEQFAIVFLSHIPQMTAEQAAEARRFTWMVDVFYDCHVKFIATAACNPDQLYIEMSGEFRRTASRLVEMQTPAYWAQSYRG